MQQNLMILHLSLIPYAGPAKVEALLVELCKGDFPNLYSFGVREFMHLGVNEKTAHLLVNGLKDKAYLEQELRLLEKHDISWCTVLDEAYPALLREIHLPPPVLYYQGSLTMPEKNIAFVGSRASSQYGKKVVQTLVPQLSAAGWGIVSGGAYGIDTVAHQATVDTDGRTYVVLGSGLLRPYPAKNKKLFEQVVYGGGAVISTFPLLMDALPQNFPARNRIISGLSHGTVVVRAAVKSGALITAKYALQQGRSVFALPGQIDDPLSAGCHSLLAQGAVLVQSAEDLFQEFGFTEKSGQKEAQDSILFDPLVNFCREPKTVEELLQLTKLPENKLNDKLFELQLAGDLHQNFAGLWEQG